MSRWELSGGNHPGGSFAGVSFHVTRLTDTSCQVFPFFGIALAVVKADVKCLTGTFSEPNMILHYHCKQWN